MRHREEPSEAMRVAKINPALLEWARKSINYSLAAAAKELDVDVTRLSAWENGSEPISIPQLRRAANLYKRPLAVFFLPEPPKGYGAMKDFRRLPGPQALSPAFMLEVRDAHARRELAVDLAADLEERPQRFPVRASMDATPPDIGMKLRRALNVSLDEQRQWRDTGQALAAWRSAVEALDVLVFRGSFPIEEARGFSIGTDEFPVVVFNVNDSYAGRIFTILHELAHVALRTGGVCDLHEGGAADVERWCNQVAAEALLPKEAIEAEPELAARRVHFEAAIEQIARRYSVSEEVVAIRLIEIGRADDSLYNAMRPRWRRQAKLAEAARNKRSGFEPPTQKSLSENGHLLARLVLTSFGDNRLTVNEVTTYLGVRAKHLTGISADVRRKAAGA